VAEVKDQVGVGQSARWSQIRPDLHHSAGRKTQHLDRYHMKDKPVPYCGMSTGPRLTNAERAASTSQGDGPTGRTCRRYKLDCVGSMDIIGGDFRH
jgi:hypothetical protein